MDEHEIIKTLVHQNCIEVDRNGQYIKTVVKREFYLTYNLLITETYVLHSLLQDWTRVRREVQTEYKSGYPEQFDRTFMRVTVPNELDDFIKKDEMEI